MEGMQVEAADGHAGRFPKPYQIVHRDCRPRERRESAAAQGGADESRPRPLRFLQWNIERGYQLEGIIEEIRDLDPDILALQELDWGCDRSNGEDVGLRIAQELGYSYAFVCEFEEHRSWLRKPSSQGGGVHGNGVLTKHEIVESWSVVHQHTPVDWNRRRALMSWLEPRKGGRVTLGCLVRTPMGDVVVYSAHFEVFCGMIDRMVQLSEVFEDARAQIRRGRYAQVLAGDLNTLAHGLARFSPMFATDRMRFRTWGSCESEIWDRDVMSWQDPDFGYAGGVLPKKPTARSPTSRSVLRLPGMVYQSMRAVRSLFGTEPPRAHEGMHRRASSSLSADDGRHAGEPAHARGAGRSGEISALTATLRGAAANLPGAGVHSSGVPGTARYAEGGGLSGAETPDHARIDDAVARLSNGRPPPSSKPVGIAAHMPPRPQVGDSPMPYETPRGSQVFRKGLALMEEKVGKLQDLVAGSAHAPVPAHRRRTSQDTPSRLRRGARRSSDHGHSASGRPGERDGLLAGGGPKNEQLYKWGVPADVCRQILNPGFVDPFDPVKDITLDHPLGQCCGMSLQQGKLDWLMLRGMDPVYLSVGNHDFSLSDHKWLAADVVVHPQSSGDV
ncbi:unnamed protein product [Pedinophyceae sp. YPF-701]|nr:unnamed protein product [Pedinophyceae sp. YPF-701]